MRIKKKIMGNNDRWNANHTMKSIRSFLYTQVGKKNNRMIANTTPSECQLVSGKVGNVLVRLLARKKKA